jgi:hypothetical protein
VGKDYPSRKKIKIKEQKQKQRKKKRRFFLSFSVIRIKK